MHELVHAHGAQDLSFPSIVASGPNGALPHAHPTASIVEKNSLVTVDWGARVDGYNSDCTRTFSTGGTLPDRLRQAKDVIDGGPGDDTAVVDRVDVVRDVEHVRRPKS